MQMENPLALRALGSLLNSRPIEEWKDALKKLEMVPEKNIQNVFENKLRGTGL